MRCACIDIGSNTTRLLIAEHAGATLRSVHEQRAFTAIGAELVGGDTISEAKCAEVLGVVGAQLAVARDYGATEVRGVATAAIRRASNGVQLIREVRSRTGLEVRILSDREEARLAFVGAVGMLTAAPEGPLGVLDVGGGSSEVVVGEAPGRIIWWASLPLGSGTLAARHLRSDPPSAAQLAAARDEVAVAVAQLEAPRPTRTLAVGGSATSLLRLSGRTLDDSALGDALEALVAGPAAVVAERLAIDPRRARLLPAGVLILQGLARRVGGELSVGCGGIREGVLLEAGRG